MSPEADRVGSKTTDSTHAFPIAPNLLARDFDTSAPNDAWVADVTFIWTREGWLYLAVVIDLFARRVVGWATSASNDCQLVLDALEKAVAARGPPPGLIHHSDRGSTYASNDYRRALEQHELVASMSRKGDCWDNAVAESFFATLRAELLDHVDLDTRDAAHAVIGEYIESFYNPVRRHSYLDYVSPIEFELKSKVAALAAKSDRPPNPGKISGASAAVRRTRRGSRCEPRRRRARSTEPRTASTRTSRPS